MSLYCGVVGAEVAVTTGGGGSFFFVITPRPRGFPHRRRFSLLPVVIYDPDGGRSRSARRRRAVVVCVRMAWPPPCTIFFVAVRWSYYSAF